jgi:hypothetical protein
MQIEKKVSNFNASKPWPNPAIVTCGAKED